MEYRKVPKSDVDGEVTAETQPFPLLPPPFARQKFTEDMVTERTPEAHAAVLEQLRQVRSDGQFVPPSLQGTVILPGFDGGGEWGGAAFDASTGLLYVNANEMAWIMKLVERAAKSAHGHGECRTSLCAEVRRLPRRGSQGHAARVSVAGRNRRAAFGPGSRDGDSQGQRPHARLRRLCSRTRLTRDHALHHQGRGQRGRAEQRARLRRSTRSTASTATRSSSIPTAIPRCSRRGAR